MVKGEVLSPAGDLNSFYTAIEAGADAVYFGLNKFNARMKADNISLNNLQEVVGFAHLKNVKIYVTLNTLVSTGEMKELIAMVEECLKAGVDAFIVQDYGVIGALKKVFPNIILHGSTQLGVHNVRGARVAKNLGLTRVVLSREIRLEDIKEISQNVDIELEVFVQGAMCVCFSGNCYLSSLKCGASGNRGECKQLCRLKYTMSDNSKSISGYTISPRDNCMLSRLKELMELGVASFKIEGRLRRKGYVNIATRTYREALDNIFNNAPNDEKTMKSSLSKVFSRGEFIEGYFNGNNIIDIKNNNHIGEKIGKVLNCTKFKDIYRIEIFTSVKLNPNDGLKFINGDEVYSLGVGNIDFIDNKTIIYGKNYIPINSIVYRVLDEEFENNITNKSKYRDLEINIKAKVNYPIQVEFKSGEYIYKSTGGIVEVAKNKAVSEDIFKEQIVKIGDLNKVFKITSISCEIDNNIFVSLSEINSLRRDALNVIVETIINSSKLPFVKKELFRSQYNKATLNKIAIVDESCNQNQLYKLSKIYEALILSPTFYKVDIIKSFYEDYKKYFKNSLILNMPIIALKNDLKILDELVGYCKNNGISILANNIYALDYIKDGVDVIAGSNMNICNEYACETLSKLGIKEMVSSIEKWCGGIKGTYRMCKGKRVLMTFAHCPFKTLTKLDCDKTSSCGYSGKLDLVGDNQQYRIRRYKISSCYFELVDSFVENRDSEHQIDDLREGDYV